MKLSCSTCPFNLSWIYTKNAPRYLKVELFLAPRVAFCYRSIVPPLMASKQKRTSSAHSKLCRSEEYEANFTFLYSLIMSQTDSNQILGIVLAVFGSTGYPKISDCKR